MKLDQYLAPTERQIYETRRHVWVIGKDILVMALALLVAAWLQHLLFVFIALCIALRFSWKALDWFYDRLIVTNQRIMGVSGLITKRVASMPLANMTDLTYEKSILGRIFGFGTIHVESAGQDQGLAKLTNLANDGEFYKTIATLLHSEDSSVAKKPKPLSDEQINEALALVQRGRPTTKWDPDETNPNMLVLP